ncbi:hypothetical protein TcCL_Unassigned06791, partial [Trypanosoma cruzi]
EFTGLTFKNRLFLCYQAHVTRELLPDISRCPGGTHILMIFVRPNLKTIRTTHFLALRTVKLGTILFMTTNMAFFLHSSQLLLTPDFCCHMAPFSSALVHGYVAIIAVDEHAFMALYGCRNFFAPLAHGCTIRPLRYHFHMASNSGVRKTLQVSCRHRSVQYIAEGTCKTVTVLRFQLGAHTVSAITVPAVKCEREFQNVKTKSTCNATRLLNSAICVRRHGNTPFQPRSARQL